MMIGNTHDETRSLIGRGDPGVLEHHLGSAAAAARGGVARGYLGRTGGRRVPPVVSAIFAGGCVFLGDDGGTLVARRHRRGGTACRAGLTGVRVPARLGLPARRRQVGRIPHARHTADVRHAHRARIDDWRWRRGAPRIGRHAGRAAGVCAQRRPKLPASRAGSRTRCHGARPWCSTSKAAWRTIRAGPSVGCLPRFPSSSRAPDSSLQ